MTIAEFTIEHLKAVLREAAGEDEQSLDGDIHDTDFDELGYDSLAMLEALSRIERHVGAKLPDSIISDATTPRLLVDTVNRQLTAAPA